ncbi:hypothetical protein HK102_002788, partial [Quaeritorhiza haematococci]
MVKLLLLATIPVILANGGHLASAAPISDLAANELDVASSVPVHVHVEERTIGHL